MKAQKLVNENRGEIEAMAEKFGFEGEALAAMFGGVLERVISAQGKGAQVNDQLIAQAVQHWHKAQERQFSEFMNNPAERARVSRQVLAQL